MVIARSSNLLGKITVLVVVGLCVNTALALDGSGTEQDPWLIQSLDDFNEFTADPNYWAGFTRLETDVNLAGREYITAIIAPDVNNSDWSFQGTAFTGVFEGNDHQIMELTIDDGGAGNDHLGLFGCNYGHVGNLSLVGGSISGDRYVGGLCGKSAGPHHGTGQSRIENCSSTAIITGNHWVGGLVGHSGATVTRCYSTGSVLGTGPYTVGGLVGLNGFGDSNALIVNCSSSAHVVGAGNQIGGLIGANIGGSVVNSSATGSVSGIDFVGGLAGSNFGSNAGDFLWHCYSGGAVTGSNSVGGLVGNNNHTIGKCFAVGSVEGGSSVGGLVGHMEWGQISECYAICDISGSAEDIAGLVGNKQGGDIVGCYSAGSLNGIGRPRGGLVGDNEAGNIEHSYWDIQASSEPNMCGNPDDPNCDNSYGKTTAEMKQQSTFQDWDFINVWNIGENQTYPYLRKYSAANINKDQIVNFLDLAIISQQWLEEI